MGIRIRIINAFNKLCGKLSSLNHGESHGYAVVNADLPSAVTRKCNRTRPTVDFNLPEALRLRDLGWGNRKIARKMNNVSRETVRTRFREYDERHPKPGAPQPVSPPAAPVPDPMPPVPQAPAVRPPVPPEQPMTPPSPPPEPSTNLDGLAQYWRMRGRPDFTPDGKCFFLVNGQKNVVFGTGSEQFVIGIEDWHEKYYDLDVFQHAERVWVILDPSQDNRRFLTSLCRDIRIREKCLVARPTLTSNPVLRICQMRYAWTRGYHSIIPETAWDWSEFEKACHFIPMPQPNYTAIIEALLAPPLPPDVSAAIGGMMS